MRLAGIRRDAQGSAGSASGTPNSAPWTPAPAPPKGGGRTPPCARRGKLSAQKKRTMISASSFWREGAPAVPINGYSGNVVVAHNKCGGVRVGSRDRAWRTASSTAIQMNSPATVDGLLLPSHCAYHDAKLYASVLVTCIGHQGGDAYCCRIASLRSHSADLAC